MALVNSVGVVTLPVRRRTVNFQAHLPHHCQDSDTCTPVVPLLVGSSTSPRSSGLRSVRRKALHLPSSVAQSMSDAPKL